MLELLSFIIKLIGFIIDSLINFVKFLADFPSLLLEVFNSSAGVFSIFISCFNSIPDPVWIRLLLIAASGAILAFLYNRNKNGG